MTTALDSTSRYFSTQNGIYALVLVASVACLLNRYRKNSRYYTLGEMIPGPYALPIFGNGLLAIGKTPDKVVNLALAYHSQYGDVIRAWLGPKLVVFLADPGDIEVVLNSTEHIDKSSEYRFFKPWLGEGLLISSGDKWRSHRKMIAPTFHINILKSFMEVFNENSKKIVEKMKSEIGKTFDVHEYMGSVTVDILLETAMGINRKTQDESGLDYASAVMKMCDIIHQRTYKFWLRIDFLFPFTSFYKKQVDLLATIHGLTNMVIKSKKETYFANKAKGFIPPTLEEITKTDVEDNLKSYNKTLSDSVFQGYRDDLDFNDENNVGEKKRLAFLDLMIESAQNGTNNLSDSEIKEEVDTIMFEGHDTTAAGSSFALCLLGFHQDVQDKVYEELYEIFGDSDRPATFADTLQMKYLERVILETLRLFPPVPAIARELKKDIQLVSKNYIVPAGTTIVIAQYAIHRNPKYYRDPEVFNPDNFLPENCQNRHYYSYVPFSAGPRSCVGRKYALLKLKVLLSTILRNYKVVSDIKEDQYDLLADIILKRADGFQLSLQPRKRLPNNLVNSS